MGSHSHVVPNSNSKALKQSEDPTADPEDAQTTWLLDKKPLTDSRCFPWQVKCRCFHTLTAMLVVVDLALKHLLVKRLCVLLLQQKPATIS